MTVSQQGSRNILNPSMQKSNRTVELTRKKGKDYISIIWRL